MGVVLSFESSHKDRDAIAALVDATAAGMDAVNKLILARTDSSVALIPEVVHYLIDSGGKRLRPMLTLAAARACGYSGNGDIKLATSVEFMHTATPGI